MLDYYHCSEYLHDLANAQFGQNSQEAREWVEATLSLLFMNDAEQVIADIEQMEPNSDETKDQIGKTVRYLGERKDMVNYGALKRGSYPQCCINPNVA